MCKLASLHITAFISFIYSWLHPWLFVLYSPFRWTHKRKYLQTIVSYTLIWMFQMNLSHYSRNSSHHTLCTLSAFINLIRVDMERKTHCQVWSVFYLHIYSLCLTQCVVEITECCDIHFSLFRFMLSDSGMGLCRRKANIVISARGEGK